MEQWQQYQVMAPQLVLSTDPILLTMTSLAKMAFRKADQLTSDSRGTVHG